MSGGLFQELRVLFTFLSEKEKNEIQSLCREHGGIVMSAITPNDPPHVVVTRRVGSPKYCSVLKRHPMTPVVSPEWIRTSVSEGRKVPYSQYAVGPCYGLKICLSGFFSEDKAKLADLVQESGGTHSASLTKHCTHLVSTSTSSEKYVFAQKHGIVCASAQWLTESIRGGWCRDSALYPVQDVSEKSHEEEARLHDRCVCVHDINGMSWRVSHMFPWCAGKGQGKAPNHQHLRSSSIYRMKRVFRWGKKIL